MLDDDCPDAHKPPETDLVGMVRGILMAGIPKPDDSGPPCPECGSIMIRNGSCHTCANCGATSGCS